MSLLIITKTFKNKRINIFLSLLILYAIVLSGCSSDKNNGEQRPVPTSAVFANSRWKVDEIMDNGGDSNIPPEFSFYHYQGTLHMAYLDRNPSYDQESNDGCPFRVKYYSLQPGNSATYNISKDRHETVTLLERGGRLFSSVSVSVSNFTPVVSYFRYKITYADQFPQADMGNQGDIYVAVHENDNTWRHEIAAYGYNPRNPVFIDGLAMGDLSIAGDDDGNVNLAFQFYYEGMDEDNMEFPDMRYVNQQLDAFSNETIQVMATMEEVIEGNSYGNNSGVQNFHGGTVKMILDYNGNPVVFYYADNRNSGNEFGLRVARRIDGQWQSPAWVEQGVEVADISPALKLNGTLAVAYAVNHMRDPVDEERELSYCLRYATDPETDPDLPSPVEWSNHEMVDFNSICGRYCSLAMDSNDQPAIAHFNEINYTGNRFFSGIKISRKIEGDTWDTELIPPEFIGLSNNTSPYEITPGQHDKYYIGKYNYLWRGADNRLYLCSYSTVAEKVYLFTELDANSL